MQSNIDSPRQSASYERKRANRACNVCRTRKTKCDNERPKCGFCLASGGECRYPDDELSEHSKLDRGTLAILKKLGDMEQGLGKLIRGHISPFRSHELDSEPHGEDSTSYPGPTAANAHNLGSSSGMLDSSHPPNAKVIIEGAEMAVDSIFTWPVFALKVTSTASTVNSLVQKNVLGPTSGDTIFDLDPETLHHLIDNFLANNHIKNPIFDTGLLWDQVRSFTQRGLGWDDTSCLILLICAISSIAHSTEEEAVPGYSKRPDRLARAEMFFQAAQRRIGMVHHETSLLSIQCSFLTAVYLMSTFRILAAWKAFSQASTQCIGWLAAHDPNPCNAQLYVEESLYWSCLKSELELRSELRLPGSSLNETDYPHIYPSPPSLDSHTIQSGPPSLITSITAYGNMPLRERERVERGWFFYLAEIALRRIMNDALSSRYGQGSWYFTTRWWAQSESGSYFRHVDDFRHKLKTWYDLLPPIMEFPLSPFENLGDPLRGILRGHYVDILDVLYFPAVRAVVCKPLEQLSTAIIQAARQGLRVCMDRITLCQEGFWHRHQGTWLMIRTCSRSASLLLGVARRVRKVNLSGGSHNPIETTLPDNWREAVDSVLDLIKYWQDESPDLHILLTQFHEGLQDV